MSYYNDSYSTPEHPYTEGPIYKSLVQTYLRTATSTLVLAPPGYIVDAVYTTARINPGARKSTPYIDNLIAKALAAKKRN